MKNKGFLKKERLESYILSLSKKGELYIPIEDENTVRFKKYFDGAQICLRKLATTPVKSVIYPQSETMFKFSFIKDESDTEKWNVKIDEAYDSGSRIIFGARPCDAKGFSIIDRVFVDTDTPDVYYKSRRENSYIATKTCDSLCAGCFCVAVGGGPFDAEGSDALITELEDGYIIEAVTEKGHIFLDENFIDQADGYLEQERKKKEEAERLIQDYCKSIGVIKPIDPKNKLFDNEDFWKKFISKCLSCGVCTYLCPTCYCFNITDEKTLYDGERVRSWDSCMFFHFTLEASGHNPRPDKFKRFRNRVGHKFMFYPERYSGQIACCGCGRCVRFCPVSVDIREIVLELLKSEKEVQGGNE